MKIAITGASGELGRLVVERLKARTDAEQLVALVRSPEKVKDLGVEARAVDYDQPQTLDKALVGVDRLLLISSSKIGHLARHHQNVIEAAKRAGVEWLVFTSLLHADRTVLDLGDEFRATEAAIKASGLAYTLLRDGWYAENSAGSISQALKNGAVIGSAGEGKIAWAPRADYAEAAAIVLTTDGHVGKTYELSGDHAYTLSDMAAEVSRQTGQSIPYKDLPQAEYAKILVAAGLSEEYANAVAGWDVAASQGALDDDSHQLSALLGRPTTSLAEVVKQALAANFQQ